MDLTENIDQTKVILFLECLEKGFFEVSAFMCLQEDLKILGS